MSDAAVPGDRTTATTAVRQASRRNRDLVLLALAGATPVLLGRLVLLLTPLERHESITVLGQLGGLAAGALWIAAMLMAYRRAPGQPLWILILAYLWTDQLWLLGYIPTSVTWTVSNATLGVHDAVTAHLLIAFPTGYLVGRSDRRLVGSIYGLVIALNLVNHAVWKPDWGPDCAEYCPENLLLVWRNDALHEAIHLGSTLLVPALAVAVTWGVWRHWRTASPSGRRVLLPVMVATPLMAAVIATWYVMVNIGWDEGVAVAASPYTLLVFIILPTGVLLGVLRASLQRSAVAELAVELGRGVPLGSLQPMLARALHDPTLEIAFPTADGTGMVDPAGRPYALPGEAGGRRIARIERDGELLGVLVHDPYIDQEDPAIVGAVGSVAGLALENERLAAQVRAQLEEVRASRARLVNAADEERRRVERDLHDGAQQRLVALAVRLQVARETAEGSQAFLDEATAELQAAIVEVRDLARGLHPPILTEAGLAAAVEALAERTPVPVRVEIPERRFPGQVEATAYYVIAEALTNVVRYADATEVVVSATVEGGRLLVSVADDGAGGADPGRGSGLRGLADRVAAARGSLSLESPFGEGTAVRAELPIA